MADLHWFFESMQPPQHPKLGCWRSLLEEGTVAHLRVEVWRDPMPLSVSAPRLFIHFHDSRDREVHSPEELDWNPRVNDELLRLKVRAIDLENEGVRFGLALRSRLAAVETPFGEGFFNAVLMEYLQRSELGKLTAVSQLLPQIHCLQPGQGAQQEACSELIEEVLGACLDTLHDGLRYSKEDAVAIVGDAIAVYLDERFSVSDRRTLGFT